MQHTEICLNSTEIQVPTTKRNTDFEAWLELCRKELEIGGLPVPVDAASFPPKDRAWYQSLYDNHQTPEEAIYGWSGPQHFQDYLARQNG